MKFEIKHYDIFKQETDCLILAVVNGEEQSDQIKAFDQLTDNLVAKLIKSGDFKGNIGETLPLYHLSQVAAKKVLLVGIGNSQDNLLINIPKITKSIADQLACLNSKTVSYAVSHITDSSVYHFVRFFIENLNNHTYRFDEYQTTKSKTVITEKLDLILADNTLLKSAQLAVDHGQIIANAVSATKSLANQPSNICNAQYLADRAKQLSLEHEKLSFSCYDEQALALLKMDAYLAVGRGSDNESIMTILDYRGSKNKKDAPIVLVGKGLTFDSGGISIKPAAAMDEMKYDMCGAATVYGVMKAIAELNLPINVIGVMAGCENMPSSTSYRPGDILTTLSGQTVEVINTDAEGRLVLCDVLTFVERYKPRSVIDIATLTGACIVALGHHYTGVLGNDDQFVAQLIEASKKAHDKAWALPMDDDFQAQIKSTCADIVNSAGRDGGTITAGCFLSRFTKNYHWAHLDIAGTAWKSGANKGATGRPVAMLIQYLLDQSH